MPEGTVSPLQPTREKKALITGGAGFIGSHLAELLLGDGWEVYALDDVSTGSLENVAHLRENPHFHLVIESVLSPSVAQRARAQVRCRLPPRRRGRRPADRRAAHPHAPDEHPGHRDRPRVLRALRQARPRRVHVGGLRRPPRGEAARRVGSPHLRADDGPALGLCRLQGGRRVPRARLPRRARPRLRDRAPLQHRRPASDRPVRNGDPAVRRAARSRGGRSRSTATARRPAASATCRTRSARSGA